MKMFEIGERVMVEGTIAARDGDGYQITLRDGELPPVGTFYFAHGPSIRKCPPTCSECGMDMVPQGACFRCENCGSTSGLS